jgi:hypothetical protein
MARTSAVAKEAKKKEICGALSQPLQALWAPARVFEKVPALPNLFQAVVTLG